MRYGTQVLYLCMLVGRHVGIGDDEWRVGRMGGSIHFLSNTRGIIVLYYEKVSLNYIVELFGKYLFRIITSFHNENRCCENIFVHSKRLAYNQALFELCF